MVFGKIFRKIFVILVHICKWFLQKSVFLRKCLRKCENDHFSFNPCCAARQSCRMVPLKGPRKNPHKSFSKIYLSFFLLLDGAPILQRSTRINTFFHCSAARSLQDFLMRANFSQAAGFLLKLAGNSWIDWTTLPVCTLPTWTSSPLLPKKHQRRELPKWLSFRIVT